jgi:hypothetical protein
MKSAAPPTAPAPRAEPTPAMPESATPGSARRGSAANSPPREIGGPKGPEPTRYGDWEVKGRCSDF